MAAERFISRLDRANQVLAVLRGFDAEKQTVELEQAGEGKADTDQMPQTDPAVTYGERIGQLDAKLTNIAAANQDIWDVVLKLRDQAWAQQEQQAAAAEAQAKANAAVAPIVP